MPKNIKCVLFVYVLYIPIYLVYSISTISLVTFVERNSKMLENDIFDRQIDHVTFVPQVFQKQSYK